MKSHMPCSGKLFIAQNFGRVNFWRLDPLHIYMTGKILADPSKPHCFRPLLDPLHIFGGENFG